MIACMIAGTGSGVGKTTAALAIMADLRDRGLRVQPFKCGPDFLDAGHHSIVCGRPCRNLDTWMLEPATNRELFRRAAEAADAVVVEGMMGLYDGVAGGGETGSSAEIAKLLNLPVVLVLDASRSARSIAAIVKGFVEFDPELHFGGIVLNGVHNESHVRLLSEAIRSATSIPLLGRLPKESAISIPERHLGLRTAEEEEAQAQRSAALVALARQYLDLTPLLSSEWMAPQPAHTEISDRDARPAVRIGVPRDKAFSFYYEDNLDLLRRLGAEIVTFSPLADAHLPSDLNALYLGGGYPEIYAKQLSENATIRADIRDFARAGGPIYAECGGLIYLGETLRTTDGEAFPMCGVLPQQFAMTSRLVDFGYVEVRFTSDCPLGPRGTVARGHSFHYSRLEASSELATCYELQYTLSGRSAAEGYCAGNVLASYVHLHLLSNPSMARSFVDRAAALHAGVRS